VGEEPRAMAVSTDGTGLRRDLRSATARRSSAAAR
jgi:hypothetical protein